MVKQANISIPQSLYRRARELARMRNQPVDDVLIDVLDQALPPENEPDLLEEETAVDREMQAYIALHPTLKEKHLGKHVAIFGGKLIDIDDDYGTLYQRIDAKYPDQFVWLATVEEEAMPTLVFRSPRLLPVE